MPIVLHKVEQSVSAQGRPGPLSLEDARRLMQAESGIKRPDLNKAPATLCSSTGGELRSGCVSAEPNPPLKSVQSTRDKIRTVYTENLTPPYRTHLPPSVT